MRIENNHVFTSEKAMQHWDLNAKKKLHTKHKIPLLRDCTVNPSENPNNKTHASSVANSRYQRLAVPNVQTQTKDLLHQMHKKVQKPNICTKSKVIELPLGGSAASSSSLLLSNLELSDTTIYEPQIRVLLGWLHISAKHLILNWELYRSVQLSA